MILRWYSRRLALGATLILAALSAGAVLAQGLSRDLPEAAHATEFRGPALEGSFVRHVISTANPHASAAGLEILRKGGSAVDAAIAAQLVLTLVEPQSSGIGGGAFMLHYNGQSLQAFDGRETAPSAATEDLFMRHGRPMEFPEAVYGGRSVGTPGVLRMLEHAHQQHGRLPWALLFEPAIQLATTGFPVSPRLHSLLNRDPHLRKDPRAHALFYQADGQALPIGSLLRNPDLAEVFRLLAAEGADGFYKGRISEEIIRAIQRHPSAPGLLAMSDLRGYRPIEREPICVFATTSRRPAPGVEVCGFPPPGSGGIVIGQIIQMLELVGIRSGPPTSAQWMHQYIEISRLAFADRAMFIADPDFVAAPGQDWRSLVDPHYLRQRALLIGGTRMHQAKPGNPDGRRLSHAVMTDQHEGGTSHLSIADQYGNVLSMTTSIESAFGARLMVGLSGAGGFLLNNQLTDFSFQPTSEGGMLIANRVQPGKRPRSSMSPTIIFERKSDGTRGAVMAALGSPGGTSIIHYTTKTILGFLDWNLSIQSAIRYPNFVINGPDRMLEIESGREEMQSIHRGLAAFGQSALTSELPSGIQAIVRMDNAWQGGSDPRREGISLGD